MSSIADLSSFKRGDRPIRAEPELDSVKAAIDALMPDEIFRVLGVTGRLYSSPGGGVRLPCPLHGGEGLSLSLFRDSSGSWRWRCHSACGTGGDVVQLTSDLQGLSFYDALHFWADETRIDLTIHHPAEGFSVLELEDEGPEQAEARARFMERASLRPEHLTYLSRRLEIGGMDPRRPRVLRIASRVLGFRSTPLPFSDDDRELLGEKALFFSLLVPLVEPGGVVRAFVGRSLHKQARQRFNNFGPTGAGFFGGQALGRDPDRPVLLCEGASDTLGGHVFRELLPPELRGAAIVGLPGVTSLHRARREALRGRKVVCAFDHDKAGDGAFQNLLGESERGELPFWLCPRLPRLGPGGDLLEQLRARARGMEP